MPERLVTIAAFRDPATAHLHRSRLELEGVPAFIADEHLVSLYSVPLVGVKLRVRERDVERALAVLGERLVGPAAEEDEGGPACPECSSLDVRGRRPSWPVILVSALFLGIPFFFRRRGWACRSCGHTWRST